MTVTGKNDKIGIENKTGLPLVTSKRQALTTKGA
jgi:hypothetical protein